MKQFTAAWVALLAACSLQAVAAKQVTVSAGKVDRDNTVVIFQLPDAGEGNRHWQLEEGGNRTMLQLLPDGRQAFVLNGLKAGQSRTYTLAAANAAVRESLRAEREGNNVNVSLNGKRISRYNGDKTPLPRGFDPAFARGGYIHPVLTPSGKLVTDDYPPAHKHHHGIWFPWTKTEFEGRKPDFWNMGQKTGTVEFVELVSTFSGPVAAGFTSKHRMVDLSAKPDPKPAIDETWDVIAYRSDSADKPYFIFDLVSTHTCASESPLILPKYHYGGVGFRGHRDWDGKDNAQFITSEGKSRANGNETPGRWVHIGGKVDGELAGVAILCHPSNYRFPQPLRIHPTEPFVCYAPQQAGDMKIEPGKPYVSRYRYIVADGKADTQMIERLWNDYANPPEVTVK